MTTSLRWRLARYLSALSLSAAVIGSCADTSPTGIPAGPAATSAARAQLIVALEDCETAHGYKPAAAAAIAENALAPNEPAWRQCAYDALRAYGNPDARVRQQIESLIVEDMAMTAAIQQGTMTRQRRKERNLQQIEAIKALEEEQAQAAAAAGAQHDMEVRRLVDGLRGFAQ